MSELPTLTVANNGTISKAVRLLSELEVVETAQDGRTQQVQINRERLTKPDPILSIPQGEFHQPVRAFLERIQQELDVLVGVVLFGSVARGEADRASETDGHERAPAWLERTDPYEGVEIADLPDWWREAYEEFREHGLRPYRPPQFNDRVLVPPVVERLEARHDVEIRFVGIGVEPDDDWRLSLDRKLVASVPRTRTAAGYTRYGIASDAFERVVRESLTGSDADGRNAR